MNPRTRVIVDDNPASCLMENINFDSNGITTSSSSNDYGGETIARHFEQQMVDNPTRNFRRVVASGGIVNTSASKDQIIDDYLHGYWLNTLTRSDHSGWRSEGVIPIGNRIAALTGMGANGGFYPSPYQHRTTLEDQREFIARNNAETDALAGRKDGVVAYGETLAEFHQVLGLHKDVLKATKDLVFGICDIARYSKDLKVGKIPSNKILRKLSGKSAKHLAKLWLTYRYAVKPVVADYEGTLSLLKRKMEERYTSRGFRTVSSTHNEMWDGQWSGNGYLAYSTMESDWSHKINYRAGILYAFLSEKLDSMSAAGLNQVLTLPWELTPYSFVIDWVTNVGDWLSASLPIVGCTTLASWCVMQYEHTVRTKVTEGSNGPTGTNISHDLRHEGELWQTRKGWQRIPGSFRATVPMVDVNLSVSKLLDIAALVSQIKGLR